MAILIIKTLVSSKNEWYEHILKEGVLSHETHEWKGKKLKKRRKDGKRLIFPAEAINWWHFGRHQWESESWTFPNEDEWTLALSWYGKR